MLGESGNSTFILQTEQNGFHSTLRMLDRTLTINAGQFQA